MIRNKINGQPEKYRWIALAFLALALAIVIIDNTVLNVAIPYILRDLNTSFDAVQWVVTGYALIIATLLITVGRLGDIWGRKKIFITGTVLFAIGSFIASISGNPVQLFFGEAFIEAIGASMMLTSSLSLLVTEFQGRERAIAFGIWGSVAGASAAIGPLLGGYLTTYYSWRWSLRINVIVALLAIIGSIFIKESKGEAEKRFDWVGVILSSVGLFTLVFGFIEGQKYGWLYQKSEFAIGNAKWPVTGISIIPVIFLISVTFLVAFVLYERRKEVNNGDPLLRISLFRDRAFSIGLATLGIVSLGQFGTFFILPIYLQNVLGFDAFRTGLVFLISSVSIMIFGSLSGVISSRTGPKWLVTFGMFVLSVAVLMLRSVLSIDNTASSFVPSLLIFGIGVGMSSSQLTNIILSSVPMTIAGEASAVNSTVRQIGTSIGVAVLGVIFSASLNTNILKNVSNDSNLPRQLKDPIVSNVQNISPESGRLNDISFPNGNQEITRTVEKDIHQAFVDSSKETLLYAFIFIFIGACLSVVIPAPGKAGDSELNTQPTAGH